MGHTFALTQRWTAYLQKLLDFQFGSVATATNKHTHTFRLLNPLRRQLKVFLHTHNMKWNLLQWMSFSVTERSPQGNEKLFLWIIVTIVHILHFGWTDYLCVRLFVQDNKIKSLLCNVMSWFSRAHFVLCRTLCHAQYSKRGFLLLFFNIISFALAKIVCLFCLIYIVFHFARTPFHFKQL